MKRSGSGYKGLAFLAIVAAIALFLTPVGRSARADRGGQFSMPSNRPVTSVMKTYAANSLIIPMDIDYQDAGVFLAYGLVYKLLSDGVPVEWIIKADKHLSTIAAPPNGATESGNTATYTTTTPHNLSVGEVVLVAGMTVPGYNGSRTVASVVSPTQFTATLGVSGLASSGNGLVMPPDFTAPFSDFVTSATGTHSYRGGPFVIDQVNRTAADPIVQAWLMAHPTVHVHVATSSFTGNVARSLVAAPHIGLFDDGLANVAFSYLNASAIPDSAGNAWSASSPDLVTPAQVAGPTTTSHHDGALFDGNGLSRFSLFVSMHYNVASVNLEAIAETGEFLSSRTLLVVECQGVRAFENNGHFLTDQGVAMNSQPASVNHYFSDQPIAQDDGIFATIGGSDPSFAPVNIYGGSEGIDYFRILRGQVSPNPDVVVLGNAFQNAGGGRVMYFGGHQYSVTTPISTNTTSHGVRYFLNAILLAPSTALAQLTGAVSRKTHGAAGNFDINLPLTGTPGIECRSGGAGNDYQVVATFADAVTFTGASVTSGTGSVSNTSGGGTNQATVDLTDVTNAQIITITLSGVSAGGPSSDIPIQMGVLLSDTNANGTVNASDVSQTKGRIGQALDATNFRSDVNANGSINATDASLVKARSGTALP